LEGFPGVNLPIFRQKWPTFSDFWRYQTRADAANELELQENPKKDDGRRWQARRSEWIHDP